MPHSPHTFAAGASAHACSAGPVDTTGTLLDGLRERRVRMAAG